MDEACGKTVHVPAVTSPDSQQHAGPQDPAYLIRKLARAAGACSRVAVLAAVSYGLVHTVRFASREPRQVAFFAGAHAALTALVVCLRRCAGRRVKPKPDSDGWGFWVKAAEGIVVDILVWVFGFRVAELGPPLSHLVWCVMAGISCLFVYYMVYQDDDLVPPQYQTVGDVDCNGADNNNVVAETKPDEKVKSMDEMV